MLIKNGRAAALVLAISCYSPAALANWTLNLGYQNPAVSTYGINLFYIGSQWGFETGIGWIDINSSRYKDDKESDKKSKTSVHLAGDIDIKYLLASGKFRPFLQAGVGVGVGVTAGDDSGVGAGAGGLFGGIGLMIGSPSFYVMGSFNINVHENTFAQGGIGFDI